MSEYTKEAKEFLKRTGTKCTITYLGCNKCPWDEKNYHDEYRVRLDRNKNTYSFRFYNSLNATYNNERPTPCDVLACLTKYEPAADVWDFAAEFGYSITDKAEYKAVEKTYKAVTREYTNVMRLFSDAIEELRSIE